MKKIVDKIILMILICALFIGQLGLMPEEVKANSSFATIKSTYPDGSVWNASNTYDNASGCCAFAAKVFYMYYGVSFRKVPTTTDKNKVKAGDMIWYSDATTSGHNVWVIARSGSTITVGEGNAYCSHSKKSGRVCWGRTINLNNMKINKIYQAPSTLQQTVPVKPNPVTGITQTLNESNGNLTISWNASNIGVGGYYELAWMDYKWNVISKTKVTTTSITVKLEKGVQYAFRVHAYNSVGDCGWGEGVWAKYWNPMASSGTNATSIKLDLYANQDGSIKLTWDNMGSYGVYVRRGTYSGDTAIIATVKNAKTWTDYSTQPSTSYYYYIQDIRNDDKVGVFSNGAGIASAAKLRVEIQSGLIPKLYWENNTQYWGRLTVNRENVRTGKKENIGNFESANLELSWTDIYEKEDDTYKYWIQPLNKYGVGCAYSNYVYVSCLNIKKMLGDGGNNDERRRAVVGEYYENPDIPMKKGYRFVGWYTEEIGGTKIELPIKATMETQNIYAHWEKEAEPELPTPQVSTTQEPTSQEPLTESTTAQSDIKETSTVNNFMEQTSREKATTKKPSTSMTNIKPPTSVNKVIKPKKVTGLKVKPRKKAMKVSYKWRVENDGYQIQYAQNKKFTKSKKTKNVGALTDEKVIKKLKKKTTYYVRVRAYKKDYYNGGKKVYGAWSKVKKVKINK